MALKWSFSMLIVVKYVGPQPCSTRILINFACEPVSEKMHKLLKYLDAFLVRIRSFFKEFHVHLQLSELADERRILQ